MSELYEGRHKGCCTEDDEVWAIKEFQRLLKPLKYSAQARVLEFVSMWVEDQDESNLSL